MADFGGLWEGNIGSNVLKKKLECWNRRVDIKMHKKRRNAGGGNVTIKSPAPGYRDAFWRYVAAK